MSRDPRRAIDRAKSYYLRELIAAGLEDLEDFYLADATMKRVRKGQEAVIDAAEVRASIAIKAA